MTVGELIEELTKFNPEIEVFCRQFGTHDSYPLVGTPVRVIKWEGQETVQLLFEKTGVPKT